MVNQIFFEINYIGEKGEEKFNCRRDNLQDTVKMLKEYNSNFKLLSIVPWRWRQC